MAAINFPNSPMGGDTFTVGDKTWVYSGGKWVIQAVAGGAAGDIALGTGTTGSYVGALVAGTGLTITNNSGEGSTPTIAIGQSVAASATPTFAGLTLNGNITFEGATADDYETIIAITDPTSDRVIVFPDLTGTVVTTGDTGSITSLMIADGTIVNADVNASAAIDKTKISGTAITAGDTGTVTSTMIADGTIVNGDINASAAIAHSKLANATAGQILLGTTTTGVVTATTISGDISIDGAGIASIAANSVALGTDTTGNYMSDLTQGTGVTITHTPSEGSNATIAIGQAVGTSASVSFAQLSTSGDLTVGGNLTVNGTTTTLNTETLSIEDNIVVLNNNVTGSPTTNAGIEVERGTSANVLVRWNETSDKWEFTNDGSVYTALGGSVAISDTAPSSPEQGAVWFESDTLKTFVYYDSSWVEIGVTAGVAVLDDLTNVTASTPSSGDFLKWNGTAWVNDAIDLGTDTTGNYVSDVLVGTGLTISHTPGEGSSASVSLNATLDNLSNVSASAPTDGYFLKYLSASSVWIPAEIPTINALDDIGNVSASAPSSGQFLKWNGTAWIAETIIGGATISDSAPASPSAGQLWFDSTVGKTFVYYDSQWIEVGGVGTGARMVSSSSAPASPLEGSMWFDTDTAQTFVYYDSSWVEIGASGVTASVQDSAPASPVSGQIWFNSLTGGTYVYYGTNWIEVGASPFSALVNTINTKGDLLVGTADNTIGGLGVGSANQVLTVDSSTATGLKWATPTTYATTGKSIAMSIVFGGG